MTPQLTWQQVVAGGGGGGGRPPWSYVEEWGGYWNCNSTQLSSTQFNSIHFISTSWDRDEAEVSGRSPRLAGRPDRTTLAISTSTGGTVS